MPAEAASLLRIASFLGASGCVFAEDEARLLLSAADSPETLEAMVARRVAGEPIEIVIGWLEFCGLRIEVDTGVFVPRHRTELLVTEAIAVARAGSVVVDLCCGCGAIGAAIANAVPGIELHAVDIDAAAVRCARRNLSRLDAHTYRGDLFTPLPGSLRHRVDVVVANVPYVPTGAIDGLPREARMYEPRQALDGAVDGLDVVRRVAAAANKWLAPCGHLLVEVSERQVARAASIVETHALRPPIARDSELEATALIATQPHGCLF
jgi:release factor glutamine methyltransferase